MTQSPETPPAAPAPAGQIYALMAAVMADIAPVAKGRRNEHFKYQFRGIDDMYNAVQPALVKHGVFCTPELIDKMIERVKTVNEQGKDRETIHIVATMAFHFYAPDGSRVTSTMIGEAFDTGDKAGGKAMSAAYKYALMQTFCIPTEGDNDVENHSRELASGGGQSLGKGERAGGPPSPSVAPAAPPPARADVQDLNNLCNKCGVTADQRATWLKFFGDRRKATLSTIADLTPEEVASIKEKVLRMTGQRTINAFVAKHQTPATAIQALLAKNGAQSLETATAGQLSAVWKELKAADQTPPPAAAETREPGEEEPEDAQS